MIKKVWHGYEFGLGCYYAKMVNHKTLRITFGWCSIDFVWGVK